MLDMDKEKAMALSYQETEQMDSTITTSHSYENDAVKYGEISLQALEKLVDEAVGRMTSRLECHLRNVVEEEMDETRGFILRCSSERQVVDLSDRSPAPLQEEFTNRRCDGCETTLQQGGSAIIMAKGDVKEPAIRSNGNVPEQSGEADIGRQESKESDENIRPNSDESIHFKKNQGRGLGAFRACKGWEVNVDDGNAVDEAMCTRDLEDLTNMLADRDGSMRMQKGFLGFVLSSRFDMLVAALIASNAVVMAVQLEHQGNETAHIAGMVSDSGTWRGADTGFLVLEHIFTIAFVIELALRIWANGWVYLKEWANRLDAFIVFQAVLDLYILEQTSIQMPNMSFLRLLRIMKLMRVLRIIRVMRIFRQLRILCHSIANSVGALCWSLMLIFVIQLIASILMAQALQSYLRDENVNLSDRQFVYESFGTFARAYLTIFDITFAPGAWGRIGRFLIYNVSRAYAGFFIVYCTGITFALLTIVRAIFLKETLSHANADDDMVVAELAHEKSRTVNKLKRLFNRMDIDGSGDITYDELQHMLKDPVVEAVFSSLELSIREAQGFFELVDDGDGRLTFDEFVTGVMRMKGSTKAIDLVTVLFENKKINEKLHHIGLGLQTLTSDLTDVKTKVIKAERPMYQYLCSKPSNVMKSSQHNNNNKKNKESL